MRVRTVISITGFAESVAVAGIACLLEEFSHRPWLKDATVTWQSGRGALAVSLEREGSNPAVTGGDGGANYDEVYEAVWACYSFPEAGIELRVDESRLVGIPG